MGEIVYPEVLACYPLTNDPKWHNLFNDLSIGNPPSGYKFNDREELVWKTPRGRNITYNIRGKHPGTLFKDLQKIFTHCKRHDHTSGTSDAEHRRMANTNIITQSKWSKIKRSMLKHRLLEDFVCRYDLPKQERHEIFNAILLAINLRQIQSDDIIIQQGKILEIRGVSIKPDHFPTYSITTTHKCKPRSTRTKKTNIVSDVVDLEKEWDRFCMFKRDFVAAHERL